MATLKLEGVSVNDLVINPNGVVLEVPLNYDKGKANLIRVDAGLRADILYKVLKVGKNVEDFFGIKENYLILLQPNVTCIRFNINNVEYFTVEMTDVIMGFSSLKSLVNVN